ncbi:MAG: OpgC protein [Arthrobacter sp.]|nr:OpgC protein [Arthrobacter sp.]
MTRTDCRDVTAARRPRTLAQRSVVNHRGVRRPATRRNPRVPGRRLQRGFLLVFLALLVAGPASAAHAGPAGSPVAGSPPAVAGGSTDPAADGGGPLLGATLEWAEDTAAGFSERLGSSPGVFGHDVTLPVPEAEKAHVREFVGQVGALGAHALLTVRPALPLERIDAGTADAFAQEIARLAEGLPGKVFVRFAPDMNSSWVGWGQQPAAYAAAFRAVAAAFGSIDDAGTVMVWHPFLAKDYPFERNRNAPGPGADGYRLLDTNGDGSWDGADDGYSPYYPGDDAVEWVGLSAYHDDTWGGGAVNSLPVAGELAAMLAGQESGGSYGNFYADYVEGRGKPLMLQTAAFFNPTVGGPEESDIKLAWWGQVLAEASTEWFGDVGAVVWDERTSTRDTGVAAIDWRLTGQPDLAAAAGARLDSSALVTGPVTAVREPGHPVAGVGHVLSGGAVWAVAAAVALALFLLWAGPRRPGRVSGWLYADPSSRDSRVDLLRGLAIVFVVVNHVGMTSLFQLFTQEALGFVSGAELFVLFSGLVLGMVFGPRTRENFAHVVDHAAKRAGKLYATALVVLVGVFLVSLVPAVNAEALTSFVDQGTGGAGQGAAGRSYDLYAGMGSVLQFPVPPEVIPGILLLQFGPWQFNVMGLYVILLLLSPLVLAALSRGKVRLVLAASAVLYVAGTVFRIRLLPSQFEDSFPLLVWQILFMLGLTAGYHRAAVIAWLHGRTWVVAACTAAAAALAFLSWCNPYLANGFDVRLAIMPDASYRALYDALFGRTYLLPGRLLNVVVLVVALYAFLTAYWKPVEGALGWFLIPLGRATLYVFIMHVALIAVISNIPALQDGGILVNTVAYLVLLAVLWVMVRTRFLFRIIPT